jgi:uncharacterized protein (DUF433 family)
MVAIRAATPQEQSDEHELPPLHHACPAICGGEPVITGTRVTVRTVLASLAEGMDTEALLQDYPTLTRDAVRAVVAFAAVSAEEDLPLRATPQVA